MMTVFVDKKLRADRDGVEKIALQIEVTNVPDIASIGTVVEELKVIVSPQADADAGARGQARRPRTLPSSRTSTPSSSSSRTAVGSGESRPFELHLAEATPSKKTARSPRRCRSRSSCRRARKRRRSGSRGSPASSGPSSRSEKDEYVIYTEGSNLEGVLDIAGVDATRTTTNSVFEIYKVFGVEAARAALILEASRTLGEQGLGVDIRHLMLVADVMTNEGDIRAIGRHGISGKKTSVLARAAFEITAAHLLRAAITGEVDELKGVAENIIVGQPITLGTGAVNLVYRPVTTPATAAPSAETKPTEAT